MAQPKRKKPLTRTLFFLVFVWWTWSQNPVEAMPPIERFSLPNSLVILLSEEHSLPFVTLQMLIDGGSRQDPVGKEGLAYLTAKGLLLGTVRQKAEAVNEALDFMGASLNVGTTKDYSTLTLRVLKKDLEKGLSLFAEVLTQPSFPEEALEKEIKKILGTIKASEERPGTVAQKTFNRILFQNSPYGHPVEGTRESVGRLTRSEVHRFYQTVYQADNAVLSIVGDITLEEVKARISPLFSRWSQGKRPKPALASSVASKRETVQIDRDLSQANIIIGGAGVERTNPDYYALTVMNYILGGGGFGSRLMEEIRVKRGLACLVTSFFEGWKYQGTFQMVFQTKNASAREAIALGLKQMALMRQASVSEDDLQRAKNYLIGSFPMRFDTQGKLVSFLSLIEYFGLGLDYPQKYPAMIKAISREDILRVARKYLHPEQTLQVIVGNLKEAGLESLSPEAGTIESPRPAASEERSD